MTKKFVLKLFSFLIIFFNFLTAFSASELKVDSSTNSSIKFSWDKDDKAKYYQIKYWEKSNSESKETEYLDTNIFELQGLDSKKYFFTLVWVDDNGTELFKSKEIEFDLSSKASQTNEKWTFSVVSAELTSENILKLTFSKNLDSSKVKDSEFKIESVKNPSDYLKVKNVKSVSSDPKSIELEFEWIPTENEEYKLTVIAIFDEKGNNIKFWVDSETRFVWWNVKKIVSDEKEFDLNSSWPSDEKNNTKEENSTWNLEEKKEYNKVLTWESGTKDDTWKNVEAISDKKENLPQTWPEMFLLLLLALIIPAWIIFIKNKKA